MPEATMARIMLWGAVRFAMMAYGVSVFLALIILFLKDKHKRNWMGAMALTFAILATAIVFNYYTNGKQESRIDLLRALYLFPEQTTEVQGGHDG